MNIVLTWLILFNLLHVYLSCKGLNFLQDFPDSFWLMSPLRVNGKVLCSKFSKVSTVVSEKWQVYSSSHILCTNYLAV